MKKIKVYCPMVKATAEENAQILQPGIQDSKHIELVHLPDACRTHDDPQGPYVEQLAPQTSGRPKDVDVMIIHGCMQPEQAIVWREQYPDIPAIIMDYKDELPLFHPKVRVLTHFKRNMAIRQWGKPIGIHNYGNHNVIHSPYCVRNDILKAIENEKIKTRDVDVSCFFDPKEIDITNHVNTDVIDRNWNYQVTLGRHLGWTGTRVLVATTLQESKIYMHNGLNMHIGKTGVGQREGRTSPQKQYVNIMARSKIIVSATPDGWEGDYRLMEALSSGAMVLHNRMIQPPVGLEDGKHWVIYDDHMDMLDKVNFYSKNTELARKIGLEGKKYVLNNHMPHHRVESWLRAINIL